MLHSISHPLFGLREGCPSIPYNLVTLLLLYLLGVAGSRHWVRVLQVSPEKILDAKITARRRYRVSGWLGAIAVLFAGRWTGLAGVRAVDTPEIVALCLRFCGCFSTGANLCRRSSAGVSVLK